MRLRPSARLAVAAGIAVALGAGVASWLVIRRAAEPSSRPDSQPTGSASSPAERSGATPWAPITAARAPSASAPAPGTPAPAGEAPPPTAPPQDPDALEAAAVSMSMRRFLRDLEYSPGLPEPPQQVVARQPAPWRPGPGVAAGPVPVIGDVSPRSAAGGILVRIRGQHFRAAQVMFGGQPAQIVSDSEVELAVLAPEGGEGTVPIAVTNGDGTYTVAPDAFTYRP